MRKFKVNEKGFLDRSYNFEGIKKQYQDEISRAKNKLNDFQEGTDYTVSYDGQKKIYTIHSPQLKKVYWGDNVPNGFEYLIEEDNEGVRTKMKMISSLGTDNFQRSIEGSSIDEISPTNREKNVAEKISSLQKELQQKEKSIQFLANYPKKQENVRTEIENIKSSIEKLAKQSSEKGDIEMTEAENDIDNEVSSSTRRDNYGGSRGKGGNSFVYWGIGVVSFLGLVGSIVAIKTG